MELERLLAGLAVLARNEDRRGHQGLVEGRRRQMDPSRDMHASLSSVYSKVPPLPCLPFVRSIRSHHTVAVVVVDHTVHHLEVVVRLMPEILAEGSQSLVARPDCLSVEEGARRYFHRQSMG